MKRGQGVHVVVDNKGDERSWNVILNGKVIANLETQASAKEKGRKVAILNEVELSVHGLNGKIREKNSYGNDPNPPVDKNGKKKK